MEEVFELFALRYMISNFGNVDSLIGKRKRMKVFITKQGYLQVCLLITGKRKMFLVHRLVAMCFIPNPNNYKQVNHIDGNKLNNHVSNLEWCSDQQNHDHAKRLGLKAKGEKHYRAKITEAIVVEIFRLRNVEKWLLREIADKFGISKGQVSEILRKIYWSTVDIPQEYL